MPVLLNDRRGDLPKDHKAVNTALVPRVAMPRGMHDVGGGESPGVPRDNEVVRSSAVKP